MYSGILDEHVLETLVTSTFAKDEMGLGKTVQAIAALSVYRNDWPVLIIAPSSAKHHWRVSEDATHFLLIIVSDSLSGEREGGREKNWW